MSSLDSKRAEAPTPDTHPALSYRKEGRRWRGKLKIPAHAHPLVRRLIAELNKQDTTMTEASAQAGLHKASIRNWGAHYHPRVDALEAALAVAGLKLVAVPLDAPE